MSIFIIDDYPMLLNGLSTRFDCNHFDCNRSDRSLDNIFLNNFSYETENINKLKSYQENSNIKLNKCFNCEKIIDSDIWNNCTECNKFACASCICDPNVVYKIINNKNLFCKNHQIKSLKISPFANNSRSRKIYGLFLGIYLEYIALSQLIGWDAPKKLEDILDIVNKIKECGICTNGNIVEKICTNDKCDFACCNKCTKKVLDLSKKKGKNIFVAKVKCPACKHSLDANKYPNGLPIIPEETISRSSTFYTAWCIECNHLKPSRRISCTSKNYSIDKFVCEDCSEANTTEYRLKICPNCKVMLQKFLNEGCNHVACACGMHLCFFKNCKNIFSTSKECYDHMRNIHGGSYDL